MSVIELADKAGFIRTLVVISLEIKESVSYVNPEEVF
tara:strand:+ start:48 stop:158 length:111 start_codon:yes stop_codon:yes gene_type:complete